VGDVMEINNIEQYLSKISSVISCKIITDDKEQIEEIHIVSDTNRSSKQISRDIQSIMVSMFGVDIDYKKISIAQIDQDILQDNRVFRLKLKNIEYNTSGTRIDVKVALEKGENIYEGVVSGPNTAFNSLRILANATLKAIEGFTNQSDRYILEDVASVQLSRSEAIITAITFISHDQEMMFSGSAFVNRDKKEAVVKATLDAVNRSISKHFANI